MTVYISRSAYRLTWRNIRGVLLHGLIQTPWWRVWHPNECMTRRCSNRSMLKGVYCPQCRMNIDRLSAELSEVSKQWARKNLPGT